MPDRLLTIPNILTLSRLPLSVILFVCISYQWWLVGLIVFSLAALTDWLDGFLARRLNEQSAIGRSLDPLTDKVMIGGAFIFLIGWDIFGITRWVVTVVIGRELLITGLRGIMEAQGINFGADWLGKVKTTLQCIVIAAIMFALWFAGSGYWPRALKDRDVEVALQVLVHAMVLVTIASGAQYIIKAVRVWRA
jgi:CDP-diacylglycerol--glycerol-3-phosphate 3-phosphatidyltransferase